MSLRTFAPSYSKGISVSPTTTTAASALDSSSRSALVVSNKHASIDCYIRTGDSTVVATAADYIVLFGQQVSLTKDPDHTHVAYLSVSGTGSLHIIPGDGF